MKYAEQLQQFLRTLVMLKKLPIEAGEIAGLKVENN
jgi:hypothetical protein